MNKLEIIDASRRILKDVLDPARSFPDDSSSFFTDSEMIDWHYWAEVEVQSKLIQTHENWFTTSTSINTVAGQEEYSMPCGVLNVVRVEDYTDSSAPIEIHPMSFNSKDRYGANLSTGHSSVGSVCYYAIQGSKFVLRPPPAETKTSAIRVYFSKIVPKTTSASTCSTIPDQYHELIIWGIVENGLIKQEANAEAMSVVLGRRNRLVEDLMKTGQSRQVQHPRQVRRKKGY